MPTLLIKYLHLEDALKFHAPGLAPVKDKTGWYHIDTNGKPIYSNRYDRAFGFYFNRATVIEAGNWFPIDEYGNKISQSFYVWCGNYQEKICAVRTKNDLYHHIDLLGNRCYLENYIYVGDFKYGFACVMNKEQLFTHINKSGNFLHHQWFISLGVYHKGYAVAEDEKGWFHINFSGKPIYPHRFLQLEPFYNGWAFAIDAKYQRLLVGENGKIKKL